MPDIVERTAKLFEAGEYPDKGVDFTEADLDRLASDFNEVPVKVEHQDTPFDGAIGMLKRVWRIGKDLMGTIGFSPQAWAFIDRANARKLSIAVSKDKRSIREVSLVRCPRVAGAQVFDGRIEMHGEVCENSGSVDMSADIGRLQDENLRLKEEIRRRDSEQALERFKRSGKITPALEEIAQAILMNGNGQSVEFAGERLDQAGLFCRFLDAMPVLVSFAEQAEAEYSAEPLSKDQVELYKKLGLDPKTAAKYAHR